MSFGKGGTARKNERKVLVAKLAKQTEHLGNEPILLNEGLGQSPHRSYLLDQRLIRK